MDDRRSPSVEEVESFEDLSTPAAQHFDLHHLEPLQIPAREQITISTNPVGCTEQRILGVLLLGKRRYHSRCTQSTFFNCTKNK